MDNGQIWDQKGTTIAKTRDINVMNMRRRHKGQGLDTGYTNDRHGMDIAQSKKGHKRDI